MSGGCAKVIQVGWLLLLSDDTEWLGAGSKPNATVCSISVEKDNMRLNYLMFTQDFNDYWKEQKQQAWHSVQLLTNIV